MRSYVMVLLMITILIASGCVQQQNNPSSAPIIPTTGKSVGIESIDYTVSQQIAKLSVLDEKSINSYEGYKNFADNVNHLIDILGEKTDFEIPKLDTTREGYAKVSKVLTEYAPLVDSYNKLVNSARAFIPSDTTSVNNFYKSAAVFGAEAAIIYVAVFAVPAYQAVGTVYRASGMQALAFKCSTCVSAALQESHWFVRTALVEGSSQAFREILDGLEKLASG